MFGMSRRRACGRGWLCFYGRCVSLDMRRNMIRKERKSCFTHHFLTHRQNDLKIYCVTSRTQKPKTDCEPHSHRSGESNLPKLFSKWEEANYFVAFPYFKIIRCYNWKESGTIRSRTPVLCKWKRFKRSWWLVLSKWVSHNHSIVPDCLQPHGL